MFIFFFGGEGVGAIDVHDPKAGKNSGLGQFLLSYESFCNNIADCMCIQQAHIRN